MNSKAKRRKKAKEEEEESSQCMNCDKCFKTVQIHALLIQREYIMYILGIYSLYTVNTRYVWYILSIYTVCITSVHCCGFWERKHQGCCCREKPPSVYSQHTVFIVATVEQICRGKASSAYLPYFSSPAAPHSLLFTNVHALSLESILVFFSVGSNCFPHV